MDYMRIRGFPFHEPVEAFIAEHEYCYVVEQNRDAQLRSLLILETSVPKEKLRPILIYGGFPLSARNVLDYIVNARWRNSMPSIAKPLVAHPSLARNEMGLTIRDYEGTMSTLCAGCGHDSITAAHDPGALGTCPRRRTASPS